ncbi:hypothetical protein CTEN210_13830 [Chaetoceros tenuissimus]|uniref:Uncharacterized protein n=2 Tax=Chaetoceros tenuissimus TaxID=426638 RepID=A0AAD3D422_9STRA|nr:hypothetical protein CTEN210_13830 [Chaetoceros tenuissimus]
MAKNTTRSKSGTCVCDWKECSDWTEVFKQSSKYEKLGDLVCIKLGNQNKSNESKYNEKKKMFENYLKVLCAHLKIDYKCVSDRTQVWVAKHHFPWTPILKDEIRYFSTPISLEKARNYGIGVVPDRRNIAIESKRGNKYFFVPNVAKNAVKKLADELAGGHINYRAARVQSRSTPAKSTIADNHQNMVSPQPDVMKVSKIRDYIAPISTLTQMLEFIVDSHLSDISADNPYDSDKFNSSLHANLHYSNISKLLKDFYRCKGSVFVKKESEMAVYYCKGIGDESKCMKTVFYKKLRKGIVPLCLECKKEERKDKKRSTRKRKAGDAWAEHDSKVNITVLSPGSRAKRLRQNRYIKHNLQYKLTAALSNQPHIELDRENSKDEQIMKLIEGASRVSSNDYKKFRAMMIESLSSNIALKQKKENSKDDTDPSIANFVDDILNKIKNFRLVREGKKSNVKYTAREIRLALSLYSMNPSAYKDLRDSSLYIYPSETQIKRWRKKSAVEEGVDPSIYGRLRERLNIDNTKETEYVQLLVDEMKLQSGIYTNIMNNKVVGIVPVGNSLEDIRKEIHDATKELVQEMRMEDKKNDVENDDKNKSEKKPKSQQSTDNDYFVPALYVNQWRIRTAFNKSANVEFFFNDGSLSGNEILYQLLHVCNQLNNVNIVVLLLLFDAGGSNSRLASLLRHGVELPSEMKWLNESLISFTDPTGDKGTRVGISHCSTHGLKALRNAFLASSKEDSTARYFRSRDGIRFTWNGCVTECFYRDRQHLQQDTMLTMDSVFPNHWNKMRVGEALRVFSEKTLVEQFMTIGQELNCFNELLFSGNRNENKDIIAMYKKRLRILRRVISTKLEEVSESVKEMFAGLEFSVYVACIFNERFMNKGQSITRENIDELEVEMKSNLEYFRDWILSAYGQKGTEMYRDRMDKWTECSIDKKTYNNLRIQICGFFFFAKKLLQHDKRVKYIPFLFSNTSSLESFFSQIRARNADTPQKYCAAVSALESKKTMDALKQQQNRMYEGTVDENEIQVATFGFDESVQST